MTTTIYEANGIKLNARQYDALRSALDDSSGWIAARGTTALALVRRGLAEKNGLVWFRITDAGRAWMAAYNSAQAVAQANEAGGWLGTCMRGNFPDDMRDEARADFERKITAAFPGLAGHEGRLIDMWMDRTDWTRSVRDCAIALAEVIATEQMMAANLQQAADAFYSIATSPSGEISAYDSKPYTGALAEFRRHLELNFPDLAERSYELAHLWAGDFGTEPVAEAAHALREKVADEKAMAAELTETEDPRNPVIVHYTGPDNQTACGMLLVLVESHQFHRAVDFNDGDEDATCPQCIAYAKRVIEDANAEQAAHQAGVDAESESRAYEPSATVLGLIAFYRTELAFQPLDARAGFVGAVREAVRIEARTQNLVLTDADTFEWVHARIS